MKLVLLIMLFAVCALAQPMPPIVREFRAVWVATVDNIDFPTSKGLSAEKQKAELTAILDLAQKLRLNAVVFQVRPMTDAVYRSKLEPWSEFLTGQMGKAQDFDPLEFLVAEAHRRGILVHAWFNPYRAHHPAAKTMSDEHVSKTQPSTVRQYGRYMWLDPTDEAAKRHSLKVIGDVVHRYDIDGVHFDDYFYPYAENDAAGKKIDFPDEENWQKYLQKMSASPGTHLSRPVLDRAGWRRMHVDEFIAAVGREIKRIKPDVVYGISPFGIWQPMPELGITGFNAYKELYADARKWLRDGTVDYLAPQLYWETARKGQSFSVLLDWWREQNVKKRFIWPGIAAYRIGATETFNAGEIASQIGMTRKTADPGAIFFSQKSLRNDLGGIQRELTQRVYTTDAVIPHFSWIAAAPMRAPEVKIEREGKYVRAAWRERGERRAFWFVVRAKDKDGWSQSVLPANEHAITLSASRQIEKIVVTAVDRLGNESR